MVAAATATRWPPTCRQTKRKPRANAAGTSATTSNSSAAGSVCPGQLFRRFYCDGFFSSAVSRPASPTASKPPTTKTPRRRPWSEQTPKTIGQYHRLKTRWRSEEHTSELQSRGHLVCRLLLEKKQ